MELQAAALVLAINADHTCGIIHAVPVCVLMDYRVIRGICALIIRHLQKAVAEVWDHTAIIVEVIKVVVSLVYIKVAMAAPEAPILEKDVHGLGNTALWHFACFHMVLDAIQITVSNQQIITLLK